MTPRRPFGFVRPNYWFACELVFSIWRVIGTPHDEGWNLYIALENAAHEASLDAHNAGRD